MTEHLAIIPYSIICCLNQLDNIYETRLFGWVLAKAQSVLKLYNKDLSDINIEHAMNLTRVTIPARYLLADGDKNYSNIIKKAFKLADKKITYERDNRYYDLTIIALPEYVKDGRNSYVTFILHNEIWHALLNFSRGYRVFSLTNLMRLSSTYSVILYLLITQQNQPITYTTMQLRKLLGCDQLKAYDRGYNFFARIIDPSRKELMEKTTMAFEYTAARSGRGGSYSTITLIPRVNKPTADASEVEKEKAQLIESLRAHLSDTVKWYLEANFDFDAAGLNVVEKLLPSSWSDDQIIAKLESVRHACAAARVRNRQGYLINTLKRL